MARRSARHYGHIDWHFFTGLHCKILHLAILYRNFAAFIQRITGGKFIPVLRNQYLDAGLPALFLIAGRQENHVAIQMQVGALQRDECGQIRRQHSFIVDRAAAIQITVLHRGRKRIDRPFRFIHAHDVHVRHQQ